jgi:surface antigen
LALVGALGLATLVSQAAPAPVAQAGAYFQYAHIMRGQATTSSGIGAWVSTGLAAYTLGDFSGDQYSGYYGTCAWYAWYRRQDEPLLRLGNAAQWASNASSHGLSVGSFPEVGATVVFQPGVQGASSLGHAAHVEEVYGTGWFLISEMSFYWNGGGWGKVSYRYAHTGYGVRFIY